MALLDDILTWSEALPEWQRDALRRAFQGNGQLVPQDLADIRAMVEETPAAPTPVPLAKAHIPTLGAGATTVLTGLTDLQDVNGFPPGRGLPLAPKGISVVFGENGAGKSGFARVLKRACRARHAKPVLANAFNQGKTGTPKATLSFISNGTTATAQWTDGGPSHADLAMVSVYDSHCSQDYISEDGPCAFLPYGLNVLGALGTAQSMIQQAVEQELRAIRLDRQQFAALAGPHDVGKHIATLGANTDVTVLTTLATLSAEEAARVNELRADLKAMDVEPAARAAETLAQRLEGLVAAIGLAERFTSEKALDKFAGMAKAEFSALAADHLAQAQLRGEDDAHTGDVTPLLNGTGGEVWKLLFQAAEAFSQAAYPDHQEHPVHGAGDQCVLCQQPLEPSAQARMERFRTFVAADAAKNLAAASLAASTALNQVRTANLEPVDAPTIADIRERDAELAAAVEAFQAAWLARREWIKTSYALGDWEEPRPALPAGDLLSTQLTTKAQALQTWATEHRKTKDPKQHAALQAELTGLIARQNLGAHLPAIKLYVTQAKKHAHLTSVSAQLNTKAISRRITALSKSHVTDELAKTLNEELRELGYKRSVKPTVTSQTRAGNNIVGLALDGCGNEAKDVLSEGEQRAIGLAFFLAEARLRGDMSTLVLDDPSTSLDHIHRQAMAEHLTRLSAARPVVILTHDAVFLSELQRASAGLAAVEFQTIEWGGNAPGHARAGLAWENETFFKQLNAIEDDAKETAKTANTYPNADDNKKSRDAYHQLRGAIERGVREIVLNGTVQPFNDEVRMDRFGAIAGFTIQDWETITGLHDKCSGVIAAHDTPGQRQQALPAPAELLEDIVRIRQVMAICAERKKAFANSDAAKAREARRQAGR
ncbi:MAG: AAA family ATPase [Pseudomonadota bacterium]